MAAASILFILCPPYWEKLPHPGLASLCAYLNRAGVKSLFFDFNTLLYHRLKETTGKDWTINPSYTEESFYESLRNKAPGLFENLFTLIKKERFSHIGFSLLKSNRTFVLKLARELKEAFPLVKIVLGGPETFTLKIEGSLPLSCADHIVIGEGEKALERLLTETGSEKEISFLQLDSLDFFPRYSEFNLPSYIRKKAMPLLFSRGCINRCSFCSERLLFKGYRCKDPGILLEEILYHVHRNSISWFTFYDSMINGDLKKLDEGVDLLLKSGRRISWDAQIGIRPDMPEELLEKMKRSGCVNLFVGLESGSAVLLEKMRKNFTPDQASLFLRKLNNAGLQNEISLILDFPGEEEKDFDDTLRFLKTNRSVIKKIAQVNLFKPYPGTAAAEFFSNAPARPGKIRRIISVLEENKIRYTPSFIGNLL